MTEKLFALFFALLLSVCIARTQTTDSFSHRFIPDSSQKMLLDADSMQSLLQVSNYQSLLLQNNKPVVNDIEQFNTAKRNGVVFIFLLLMIAILTYIKTAFSKDLEEMLQSLLNRNIAQQIFRTRSGEISLPSTLLHLNFVVAISLYVRFILVHYFHVSSLETFSSILFLIFLFTFFYVLKMGALKFIGVIFEAKEDCEEYVFNFSTACKTAGLTLIPALFIFYAAPSVFFNFIFSVTILIFAALVALFFWRGLSTGYKLLYRSVYHFFIYVCVVEISPIFLLFKLLTKTVN